MTDDWLPIRQHLTRCQEVFIIANKTGLDRRYVAGALLEIWDWAVDVSVDGYVDAHVDAAVDGLVPLFSLPITFFTAMVHVGWLEIRDGKVIFPKWEKWLSKASKSRLHKSLRQKSYRITSPKLNRNVDAVVDTANDTVVDASVDAEEDALRDAAEAEAFLTRGGGDRDINSSSNTPIRNININISPAEKTTAIQYSPNFVRFWEVYPNTDRRRDKGKCYAFWCRHRLEEIAEKIIENVKLSAKSEEWMTHYEPQTMTYLNQKRWESEPPPISKPRPANGNGYLTPGQKKDLRIADKAAREFPEPLTTFKILNKGYTHVCKD